MVPITFIHVEFLQFSHKYIKRKKKNILKVGFKPTSTLMDCNLNAAP